MTDIVERLLAGANDPMWANHSEFPKKYLKEAADEIERLRSEVALYEKNAPLAQNYLDMLHKGMTDD
ncbi:MAG: hypothetical protein ACR2PS_18460 [Pseudomonadales bacterium]